MLVHAHPEARRRRVQGPHRPVHRRAAGHGGSQLRCKCYATVVASWSKINAGKRSVALESLDGSRRVAVGNVTIPTSQPVPLAGVVVEVRYLYAYPGGSLNQPAYLCRRDDVDRDDCRLRSSSTALTNGEDDVEA